MPVSETKTPRKSSRALVPTEKMPRQPEAGDECSLFGLEDKSIRQTFTDLIEAKIEFDSQFLNFNALLNKNASAGDFHCLYQICTNSNAVLEQVVFDFRSLVANNYIVLRIFKYKIYLKIFIMH